MRQHKQLLTTVNLLLNSTLMSEGALASFTSVKLGIIPSPRRLHSLAQLMMLPVLRSFPAYVQPSGISLRNLTWRPFLFLQITFLGTHADKVSSSGSMESARMLPQSTSWLSESAVVHSGICYKVNVKCMSFSVEIPFHTHLSTFLWCQRKTCFTIGSCLWDWGWNSTSLL